MKKSGTMKKVANIRNALSYVNTHFFAPVDMEIPDQGQSLPLERYPMQNIEVWLFDCFVHAMQKTYIELIWLAFFLFFFVYRYSKQRQRCWT
jgi:hypothetical protein